MIAGISRIFTRGGGGYFVNQHFPGAVCRPSISRGVSVKYFEGVSVKYFEGGVGEELLRGCRSSISRGVSVEIFSRVPVKIISVTVKNL